VKFPHGQKGKFETKREAELGANKKQRMELRKMMVGNRRGEESSLKGKTGSLNTFSVPPREK